MAITERASQRNSNVASSVTSGSLSYPSVPVPGNLLVCCLGVNSGQVSAIPAGWAAAAASPLIGGIYYKIAGAGESQTPTWNFSGLSGRNMQGYEFSGVAAIPLDVTASNSGTGNSGSTGALPALAGVGELVVALFRGTVSTAWSGHSGGLVEALETSGGGSDLSTGFVVPSVVTSVNYSANQTLATQWYAVAAAFKAAPGSSGTGFLSFFD